MYAQLIEGQWKTLDGRDIEFSKEVDVVDDEGEVIGTEMQQFVASSGTVALWSNDERGAAGIKAIVDDATEPPEGKQRGSYEVIDVAGVPTRVWNFVDTPPAPVPSSISDRQFAHILAKMGLIQQSEALAWIKVGDVPEALQTVVDAIPDEADRFDAQMLLSGATTFERAHPMTGALASGLGMTAEQVDNIWRQGAQL